MRSNARSKWLAAEEWLISAALALTTATQLRFFAYGFGLGEILVSLWCLFALLSRHENLGDAFVRRIVWACGLMTVFLVIGVCVGAIQEVGLEENIRDMIAYAANLILVVAVALSFFDPEKARRVFVRIGLCLFLINALAALLAEMGIEIPFVAFRVETSHRLHGFSTNPNQISLGCSIIFAAALLLQWPKSTRWRLVVQAIIIGATFYIGYLTDSDALKVGMFAFCTVLFAAIATQRLVMRSFSTQFVGLSLLFATLSLATAIFLVTTDTGGKFVQLLSDFYYAEDDQGDVRMMLWRHGLFAFWESKLLGFGPGAYSGLAGPFEGVEAHNSFIDLACSAGIGGVTLVLFFFMRQMLSAFPRQPQVAAFLVFIVTQMAFNFFLRHFVLWASVILIYAFSRTTFQQPATRSPALHRNSNSGAPRPART